MTLAATSLEAFELLKPTLSEKRQQVLDYIRENRGLCCKEIARGLGWEINKCSGRVTELSKLNLIVFDGTRMVDGRNVQCWRAR